MAKTKPKRAKDCVSGKTNAYLLAEKNGGNGRYPAPPPPLAENNAYS